MTINCQNYMCESMHLSQSKLLKSIIIDITIYVGNIYSHYVNY